MALTPSSMVPLGTTAPDFALADTSGRLVRLADFASAPVLVVASGGTAPKFVYDTTCTGAGGTDVGVVTVTAMVAELLELYLPQNTNEFLLSLHHTLLMKVRHQYNIGFIKEEEELDGVGTEIISQAL